MKVLFLEVDTEASWAVAAIGPSFLAPVLQGDGHQVLFHRARIDETEASVRQRVRELAPDLLALSLTTRQWQRGRKLVATIRAELDIPTIAGGLHPTFSPEAVLSSPGFDFVCLGEGEGALKDLVRSLEGGGDGSGIDNIWKHGRPFQTNQGDETSCSSI